MADVESEEISAGSPARSGTAGVAHPTSGKTLRCAPGRLCPRSPLGSRKTSEAKRSAEQTTEMLWQRSYAR